MIFITAFLTFEIPLTSLSEAKLYDGCGTEVDGDVFEEVVKWPDRGVFKLTLNNDAQGMCWFGYLWHHFQNNHTFDMPVLSSLCISESSLMRHVSAISVMGGSDHCIGILPQALNLFTRSSQLASCNPSGYSRLTSRSQSKHQLAWS